MIYAWFINSTEIIEKSTWHSVSFYLAYFLIVDDANPLGLIVLTVLLCWSYEATIDNKGNHGPRG